MQPTAPVLARTLRLQTISRAPCLPSASGVDEVNVLFIATDKHGKFVRDLNQNDFSILDDHKPPQAIINFHRETDLALHLGLLVDVSGSVHGRFDFEQTAAISFCNTPFAPGSTKPTSSALTPKAT